MSATSEQLAAKTRFSAANIPGGEAVDTVIERAYRRTGWRVVTAAVAITWVVALVWGVVAALLIARVGKFSSADRFDLVGFIVLDTLLSFAVGMVVCARLTRPLAHWSSNRNDREVAALAWRQAHRFPAEITRRSIVLGVVFSFPGILLSVSTVRPLSPALVTIAVTFTAAAIPGVASVGAFGIQLAMRPLIRDIALSTDRLPVAEGGASIRVKLLVAVPLMALAAAFGAVMVAVEPGTSWNALLWRELAVAALVMVLVVPGALLLARSMLRPLDDLLLATERLKRAQFDTPVPELSADEYGVLARSFNEAIDGLAERQQLAGQNEHLLAEVRASRARIVEASDAERRRVERNIHDGAQQRLVALALDLRMLEQKAAASQSDDLHAMAEAANANLKEALDELRELARGLHPSVLASDGLPPALEQLASRAPVPVTITAPRERFPEVVEATVYFVVCEALANMAKYAQASHAEVSVAGQDGHLRIEISDDGIGGAKPAAGSGLAGLADRVAALDGALTIISPVSGGTRVVAEMPLPDGKS